MRQTSDRGATAVEYALVIGLIAVVALVGIVTLGRGLSGSLDGSAQALQDAVGATSTATSVQDSGGGPAPATVVAPDAEWTRVGNSANYRWECANGRNLGSLQDVRSTPTPPGPAPACG